MVQDLVSLDLSEDAPVIEHDDGLLEWVEVGVVTPEAGVEPVGKGFEGLVIEGWCEKGVNNASIMLTSCSGAKSCHSAIVQLFDEDSRALPIWARDSEGGEPPVVVLKSIGA